jgi:hypothetical protein
VLGRFGSGSGPFALNAEPEPGVRFGQQLNLEPERAFRFGSAFERVQNLKTFGHIGDLKLGPVSCLAVNFGGKQVNRVRESHPPAF